MSPSAIYLEDTNKKHNIMKKSILIVSLVIGSFSLMAFKFMNSKKVTCIKNEASIVSNQTIANNFLDFSNIVDPRDLLYKVESRFLSTISKSDLDKAKTIIDILPENATKYIDSYYYARVSILDDHVETDRREISDSEVLTEAQINLIQSTNDSGNIYIRSDYKNESGLREHNYLTYFISIVPDQQAKYQDGDDSLIEYLRKNSEEQVKIIRKDGLKGGKVRFTISKEGKLADVSLTSTSGYESVDKRLIEIIENIPGQWTPAANENGELVDQELGFFFGVMGC
jgi:hypothetical protein